MLDQIRIDDRPGRTAAVGRSGVFIHALLFVAGFTVVFSFLGASVGLVGYLVQDARRWINLLAGILLVLFGIHVTGLLRLTTMRMVSLSGRGVLPAPFGHVARGMVKLTETLYRQKQIEHRPAGRGVLSSFGVGMIFAIGWTPCVGFVLGGILSAAFNSSDATGAMLLLMAYSFGLGIPFLLVALFIERARGVIRALQRHATVVNIISGAGLFAFGLLIALDFAPRLGALLGSVPVIDDLFLTAGFGESLSVAWIIPAFAAGVLSFLSPCVLPLVPVYLVHLAGAAAASDIRTG